MDLSPVGQHARVNWLRRLSWKKRIGVAAGALFLLFVAFVGIGYALTTVPQPNKIAIDQATTVLYADGKVMGRIGTNRTIVPLEKISKDAQHAILAAEDRGFYSEPGVSPKGIGRALFSNVRAGGVSQGGSTITQQYAKNAFLTQDRTFTRKVKEVFIALKMSQTTSKDTILESYLNTIYFGRGAYGIEAAANVYFGVSADKLTAPQAAVLASSIRSPAAYDPARHPEKAKQRWDYVLDGMVKQRWLSAADRTAAKYPTVLKPGNTNFPGPLDYVRERLIAELGQHGFAEDRITAGGLVVRTTLLRRAQDEAVKAVEGLIPKPATGDKNPPVAALVAVQPGTGKVIAYYGGREAGGFDYAGDGKGVQPGSSMKPYVLAAALEKGTSVDSKLDGSSPQKICGTEISNDAGDPPLGATDLATGLQYSVNTVYYRLACDTGAQRVADAAHNAGIPKSQKLADPVTGKPTAQIALGAGGYEIHVIDQATGYASFAAKGTRATPYFVAQVTDSHKNELYKAKTDTGSAFSEGVAADVTYAMQKVVQGGTGTNAQLAGGRPTAGKTGTTGNNANAWFAGFTPQLSTAVWVGRTNGGPLKGVLGSTGGVYGGTVPAKIFKAFMDAALQGEDKLPFPPKAGIGKVTGATPTATATATATASPTAAPTTAPPVTAPPILPTSKPTKSPKPQPSAPPTTAPPPPSPQPSPATSP